MSATLARPFAALWDDTRRRLEPLGVREQPIPDGLDHAEGSGGRMRLRAACWALGKAAALAECRIVLIQGAATEIVNTMIFPSRCDQLPVFAAELLAFGHRPRLAFLDLQAPGLSLDRRARALTLTSPLAERWRAWQCSDAPPNWATEFSPGGFLYSRPDGDEDASEALVGAYHDYLTAWLEMAASLPREIADSTSAMLDHYKSEHVAHSPGKVFLGKLFGSDWTHRFLLEFLYR